MKIKGKYFLNNQEFFDAAWNWLVVENNPRCPSAYGDRGCYYRRNDTTCVVGAFIPDDFLYNERNEIKEVLNGSSILSLMDHEPKIKEWFKNVDENLLQRIQVIHDTTFPKEGEQRLFRKVMMEKTALHYKLHVPSHNL